MKLCPNCFSSRSFRQNTCTSCGYNTRIQREPRALPEGLQLHKRYIIGRILGIGGFGITYLAYDQERKLRVAVKEYFPAEWAMRSSSGTQLMPNSRSMDEVYRHGQEVFINEAKVLYELKDVPNVVDVQSFFAENGTAYMVMELVDGNTLSGYMRRNRLQKMSWEQVSKIVREIGQSLIQVHEKMLLHRDIGPDNIMIRKDGDVSLIDFGATRMYALNSERSMSVMIKPGFAPLEQYSRNGTQGPWTDVYALAATCYFLLTGEKPPEAPARLPGTMLTPIVMYNQDVPEYVNNAVEHALEPDWRSRTRTMKDFLREMEMTDTQKPSLLKVVDGCYERILFSAENRIRIGRLEHINDVVLKNDKQIGRQHCEICYDFSGELFEIINHSRNRIYTCRGVLQAEEKTRLQKGDWLYLETASKRYIFYLEVN